MFFTTIVLPLEKVISDNVSTPFPQDWENVYNWVANKHDDRSSSIYAVQAGHYLVASFSLGQSTFFQQLFIVKRGDKYYSPMVRDNYDSSSELVHCKNYEIPEKLVHLLIEEMSVQYRVYLDDKLSFKLKSASWYEDEGLTGLRNDILNDILSKIGERRTIEVTVYYGYNKKFTGTAEFCEWVRDNIDPAFIPK